jgi:hypothetical protein
MARTSGNEKNEGRLVRSALSADGRRITWSWSSGGVETIYQRIDNLETKKVSEITGTGSADYWGASRDGEEVLFIQGGTLYKVNVDDQSFTVIANTSQGVVGESDDASYVYFVSSEALAPGATAGQPNLYLFHQGTNQLIGQLSPIDVGNAEAVTNEEGNPSVGGYSILASDPQRQAARVTSDGLGLAFQSVARLTGYDNRDVKNDEPDVEVFVYDAATEALNCASCKSGGARPNGKPLILYDNADELAANNNGGTARRWTAAFLQTVENQTYYPRDLSDDGNKLFFNAFDALVPEDNNNQQDVYEWEAHGVGDCTEAGGCISLISTGESPVKSEFVDASESGSDVFFMTRSGLAPQDPGLIDIYNAKEGGGFEALPAREAPCEAEACQTVPAAPNDPTPASASYNGPENVKHKSKKKQKRHHRKHRKHRNSKAGGHGRAASPATHGNG